jgi:hypothetical protein
VYLLQCLGFKINQKKICARTSPSDGIPGPDSRHIPNGVETPSGQDKEDPFRVTVHDEGRAGRPCSAGGEDECNITSIPTSHFFYYHLQMALAATLNLHSQCYEAQVLLTKECREELMWWDTHMINWNGKSLLKKDVDMIIDSDASLTGWGATSQNQRSVVPGRKQNATAWNC